MRTLTTAFPESAVIPWPGGAGELVWQANSTAGGGSPVLSLQRRPVGGTDAMWTQIGSGSNLARLTAAGTIGFGAMPCELRMVLSGSTGATIYCDAGRYVAGNLTLG